ncbi:hypothetical protein H9L14_01130 [Sphingomonas sediminicola]|uniref:Uncharacterized protein n=1 Tax=Sphingomonas sediminicola TaxID=386874 RepID=A0ABX6T8G9_9SPHN|nr:hypothetical protein [Sphingomonas sediminicola]QNP45935.1 hypothetical protein H9L14_01130 [Sphingomonas sediminicola]
MTAELAIDAIQRGLPPLRGRLLWTYRLAWVLLAAATLATLALALFDPAVQPLVLGLRLLKSAIVGAVATVLFWRRQRDPVAAILSLAFLCWTITSSFDFTSAAALPMLLDRLRFLFFAFALLLFPDGKWRPRWTRGVAVLSIAVFLLGVLEAVGLLPTSLFLPLAIVCVLAAIVGLIQRFRASSSEMQQQQLKWVALGLVSGVGLILVARTGAALSMPAVAFEAMFQLGIVLVALGFLVPLLRYRLYDAEAVISRSAAYAVLTVTLVATFAGSESLIELLGQQYLGSGIGQVSGAIGAAIAAVLLTPLNDRISAWAEQRFQRDLVQLKAELPAFLSEAPSGWSPRQVGNAVLPRIADAIHATKLAIVIKGKVIAADGIEIGKVSRSADDFLLRLPFRCPFGGVQGRLLVGPRPDGSSYGKDEIEALEEVLPALRRSLLAALERETAYRSQARMQRSLRAQIAEISIRIRSLELKA